MLGTFSLLLRNPDKDRKRVPASFTWGRWPLESDPTISARFQQQAQPGFSFSPVETLQSSLVSPVSGGCSG